MAAPTVVDPPARGAAPLEGPTQRAAPWQAAAASPLLIATLICLALAAVSAALLPTVPSYDPWAWIVWGREVVDPHLSFAVGGGPSWKPLPVIFTTVYALFGGAAPLLWVITARAGGLLGLAAAYRLARRVAAGSGARAGTGEAAGLGVAAGLSEAAGLSVAAGMIAAAGIVLTQDWGYYMFRGTSEPLLIATSLWAVDRHLEGRRGSAFVLGVATGLMRPEAWPIIGVYALWLWAREPRLRVLVLAGLASIPFFWFVPPWIGSGHPFLAATHARAYNGHLGSHPLITVVARGLNLQVAPAVLAAAVAVGIALVARRRRDERPILWLAALVAVWWVVVVGMTLDGYPGLERFFLPAAAMTCVLGGVGIVAGARLVGDGLDGLRQRWPRAAVLRGSLERWLPGVMTLALIAVSVPFTTRRASVLRAQEPIAARAATRLDQLSQAAAAVGGHRGVYPCRISFAAVNHSVQTALAWKLHVTLGRVGTSMRHQGLMFVGPHDSVDGAPPRVDPRLTDRRLIAHVGAWRVYRMTSPGSDTRCVGG